MNTAFRLPALLLILMATALPVVAADAARPDWLALATQDPQSRALLEKAIGKLGLKNFDDLLAYVKVCDLSKVSSTLTGQTDQSSQTVVEYATEAELRSGKEPGDYFQGRLAAEQAELHAHGARVIDVHPDYVREQFWVDPSICLRAGMAPMQTYETFIHELTHLVETDQLADEDMLAYVDFDDYALQTILAPGSEVDAFIAGTAAHS
ncbi:MAG: hypothetical protein HY074_00695 [Deltaproteobacteria bacterium]|nr:hypothetical protein [Deltaproteobacteria bacterium]